MHHNDRCCAGLVQQSRPLECALPTTDDETPSPPGFAEVDEVATVFEPSGRKYDLELVWNLRKVTQSNGKHDVVCAYGPMIQDNVEVIIDGDIQANHLGGLRHH